jgi:hypothetical protein
MWSYILGTLGVLALFTIGQKKWYGWFMALTNEALWSIYGYTTKQYGFIFASIAYGTVNLLHGIKWFKQKQHQNNTHQNKHIHYIDFTPNTRKPFTNNN